MTAQRCGSLTPSPVSPSSGSLPPLGLCRPDLRRCPPHPFMPASPTPGSRQLEVKRVTHVAGPSMESLDQQASSINPRGHHSGLPALQRPAEEPRDPGSTRCTRSRPPCPASPQTWERRPGGGVAHARLAHAAPSPSAVQTTTPAAPRSQPAHPGSRTLPHLRAVPL